MILYFTGTGNSRYVAEIIKDVTNDDIISINDILKNHINKEIRSERPFVFVCPTYAWRIPRVVEGFIKETQFIGNKDVYFIMTCGSDTGNSLRFINRLCEEKAFNLKGLSSIVMPENYIAMFKVPTKEEAEIQIKEVTPHVLKIGEAIKGEKTLAKEKIKIGGRAMSALVNPLFYPLFVKAKGFYATTSCVGCGKCLKLCPLNNITMKDKKPVWANNCTHCMACICGCPFSAIEYKNKTQKKQRYYIEK